MVYKFDKSIISNDFQRMGTDDEEMEVFAAGKMMSYQSFAAFQQAE